VLFAGLVNPVMIIGTMMINDNHMLSIRMVINIINTCYFVFSCYKVFPFMIQEQLISSSFCKILGWSILIQSFAKLCVGDILADTAILGIASKKDDVFLRRAHKQSASTAGWGGC